MSGNKLSSSAKILRQFYVLRNITISFLFLMVFLSFFVLQIKLPILSLSFILMLMMIANVYTRFAIDPNKGLSQQSIFIQVLLEIFFFSLIFYFSGGATNPFTFLYLIPLAIAAIIIPGKLTWMLTFITIFTYGLLLKFYVPLTYDISQQHHSLNNTWQFSQHVLGMWFGFFASAILVTWFVSYLSKELKKRDDDIAQAKQLELRNQQMVALGALAAGTAHELGTPLASMSIITGELTNGFKPELEPDLFENQKILKQQIGRCKKILSVLSDSAGESRADEGYRVTADVFVKHILEYCQKQRTDVSCIKKLAKNLVDREIIFDKTISQSLINLVNNAADSSSDTIKLRAYLDSEYLVIELQDNGIGMTDQQINLAGDIAFSTKPDGMGIGLFLAITSIRRFNGSVDFNRLESKGMNVLITLPLIPSV